MSTAPKGLRAVSAYLRQKIEVEMQKVPDSLLMLIKRRQYSTFRRALLALPDFMGRADWCLVPPGDAPSSKRFYDAISHFCIPYLLADEFYLPFEDVYVNYENCVRQLPGNKVELMASDLNNVSRKRIEEMRRCVEQTRERFAWNYDEKPKAGQALWTLSWALYDRFRMISPYLNNEMTGFGLDSQRFIW
jgi:hypothetical protein